MATLRTHVPRRGRALLAAVAVTGMLTAACGTSTAGSTSNGGGSPASDTTPVAGSCGSVPSNRSFSDDSGVIKTLGGTYASTYNGYPLAVKASKWASWTPSKKTGFTVGIAFGPMSNGNQTSLLNGMLSALKASPLVKNVVSYTTNGPDVSQQIQNYQSLVQQHVDLIIYEPLSADAFVSPVTAAAAAGIPSLAVNGQVDSPDSVNFTPNAYLYGADGGAYLGKLLNGKGNVLEVQGVPVVEINKQNLEGFTDAMALCKGIKVVGQVTGQFSIAPAQAATLQFLSSHPQKIDAVWEASAMATGVINAFSKLARTVPPITSASTNVGYLAYLAAHSSYQGIATELSPAAEAKAAAHTALKMLHGDGVKVNAIVLPATEITAQNVNAWNPGSDTQSAAAPSGPDSLATDLQSYVDKLFTK